MAPNGMSMKKWVDKKEVFMASNYFDLIVLGEVIRLVKDRSGKQISCPLTTIQYNKYMGGVDLSAQKIKYCAIDSNWKTNCLRIFLYFPNMSLVNILTSLSMILSC